MKRLQKNQSTLGLEKAIVAPDRQGGWVGVHRKEACAWALPRTAERISTAEVVARSTRGWEKKRKRASRTLYARRAPQNRTTYDGTDFSHHQLVEITNILQ